MAYCPFFFETSKRLVSNYRNLFADRVDESGEEVESDVTFSNHWGWIEIVDRLADKDRTKWDYFLNMNVIEFLNAVAYDVDRRKDKARRIEQAIKGKDVQGAILAILLLNGND